MTQVTNNYAIPQGSIPASGTSSAAGVASTNTAAFLAEMLVDLVIGLESQNNAVTNTSTASTLPTTTEPTASTGSNFDPTSLATMGEAVGAGMASTGLVNWNDFVQQTEQTFSQAGLRQTDIDTYLGAVMDGYTKAQSSQSSSIMQPPFGGPGPAIVPSSQTPTISSPTISVTTSTTGASTVQVDPSQLPPQSTDASQFTQLAISTFNKNFGNRTQSFDINAYVANTQQEMMKNGYSQSQINNYMTGLYEAYNNSAAGALPSSNTQQPNNYNQPGLSTI